jgi:transposase-like protein
MEIPDDANLSELCEAMSDEERVFEYLQTIEVVPECDEKTKCNHCKKGTMKMIREGGSKGGLSLRCSNYKCRRRHSIWRGTFLESSRVELRVFLRLLYCWINKFTNKQTIKETRFSQTTVCKWFHNFRLACGTILMEESEVIGGPGKVVEIDEAKFFKRKYNRGRRKSNEGWVLGGIERGEGGGCFLVWVPNRSKETLVPIIKKYVRPGTTVYTDCWKSYSKLSEEGFDHAMVNHSVEFVSSADENIHTNKIEGTWKHAKRSIPETGTSRRMLESYLLAFMYRKRRSQCPCLLKAFLVDLGKYREVLCDVQLESLDEDSSPSSGTSEEDV